MCIRDRIWHLTDDPRLGEEARNILDMANRGEAKILVPSIVLAECLYLLERRGQEDMFLKVLDAIERHPCYEICPFDAEVLRVMIHISCLNELHDRIIVATAKIRGAILITEDEEIRRCGCVPTIW